MERILFFGTVGQRQALSLIKTRRKFDSFRFHKKMTIHKYTTQELVSQKPPEKKFRSQPRNPIVFILHNLRSLENVGLFFRLADALLIEKIYLTGYTGYPRLPKDSRDERIILHAEKAIAKTAIKTVPFVPWEYSPNVLSTLSNLSHLGYLLVAVEQTTTSLDYRLANYKFPLALIFGHERTGVESKLLARCDQIIHLPMLGMGNSHNVAVSAAIISSFVLDKLSLKV